LDPIVVSRLYSRISAFLVACGKARSAGNGASHCQGTQRGHRPRGTRPPGAGGTRHYRVAALANTHVFAAGCALYWPVPPAL